MIAGVDLGGTRARVAVARRDGTITGVARTPTATVGGPAGFVAWVARAIDRLGGRRVDAIGIGTPGPVDAARGILVNPPNLPGWHHVPLRDMLSQATGAHVHLGNDADLAALGEFSAGAGRGSRNLVYITWSTGIGSGLILGGRLYSGSHGSAGEIGHTIVDPSGPLCTCGQRGCLEAVAAGHGIATAAGRPAVEVFAAAASGEAAAQRVVEDAARHMGQALVNVTNTIDPDVIVIGGGITSSWALVRPILLGAIRESPFISPARRPRIVKSRLGDRVGLVGAVHWARVNAG